MNITVYSKSDCPYCEAVTQLLDLEGQTYKKIVIDNFEERNAFYDKLQLVGKARTMPQVFANDELIGGYDKVAADPRFRDDTLIPVLMTHRQLRYLLHKSGGMQGEFGGIRSREGDFTAMELMDFNDKLKSYLPKRPIAA